MRRSIRRWAPVASLGLALAGLAPAAASGQTNGIVTGVVRDGRSGAPVVEVSVSLEGIARSVATDRQGRFTFDRIPPGTFTLRATRLGYEDLVREGVRPDGPLLELTMTPRALELAELVVSPGTFSYMASVPGAGQMMTRREIESVPQFGEDIFRAVKRLPGLTSGDYAAHFSVRGGRPDQNLILLDGLEIYEPYHLKDYNDGAFSIVDVETIGGVELMTGSFPARYGNRASGVFSMTSRDPDPGGAHYDVGLSFLNARAMAGGSFANGRGSWLVSGRRGYLDLLLGLLKQIDLPSPRYYDLFGKARYDLSSTEHLSVEVLHARDHYVFDAPGTTGFNDSIDTREIANNRYGNSYVWSTLRSLLGEHVAVSTMVSAGLVTSSRDGEESYVRSPGFLYQITNTRDFHVYGLKQDWRLDVPHALSLRWGIDARKLDADYALTNVVGQNPDDPTDDTLSYYPHRTASSLTRDGSTFASYGSVRLAPAEPVTLEMGLRYDRSSYTGDRDLSPRVNALVKLPGSNSVRFGWGYFRQMEGIAEVEALEGPGTYFPSELSKQWTVGVEHAPSPTAALRIEAYVRTGSRPRPVFRNYRGGLDVFPETSEDRILVHPDSVASKGIEVYWRRSFGDALSVTGSYALARLTERTPTIDAVNVPEAMTFRPRHDAPQDQRHAAILGVDYRPSAEWTLSASYAFHTGWPGTTEHLVSVTTPEGALESTTRPDTLYGSRYSGYQRLDVRMTKRVTKARGDLRFFFEVTNLTNHTNVFGYDYFLAPGPNGGLALERDDETGFIIMPSLGVSWRGAF